MLVVNRKHSRGRATQAKRTCRVLSLCHSLSLAYAHTHTETFLSMLQMSKWQKPGNSKDSDAHTARTPTLREVYTSCRPAQQIVLSLALSLSLGRDSLSRASLSAALSLSNSLSLSALCLSRFCFCFIDRRGLPSLGCNCYCLIVCRQYTCHTLTQTNMYAHVFSACVYVSQR